MLSSLCSYGGIPPCFWSTNFTVVTDQESTAPHPGMLASPEALDLSKYGILHPASSIGNSFLAWLCAGAAMARAFGVRTEEDTAP